MFQGTTLITLDDKGRLALPKRARDEAAADGVIVAARHPQKASSPFASLAMGHKPRLRH